jgi:hypothetical protein
LRPATDRQNNANIGLRSNNTSGYKGVVWRKPGRHRTGEVGRWWARISVEGKVRSLGLFDDPVEAACAYNRAALEAFGEFAWLNPVPDEVAVRMAAAAEIKSRPKAKPQSKSRPSPAANRTALVASRAKPAANRRIINSMETSKLPAPKVSDRISIALIPKAVAGLAALQERTGLSKTDAVNRAISLYEFIDTQLRAGRDLLVRDPETGKTQLVHLL